LQRKLRKHTTERKLTLANLAMLKTCKKEKLQPTITRATTIFKCDKNTKEKISQIILQKIINNNYNRLNNLNVQEYHMYKELSHRMHPIHFDEMITKINATARRKQKLAFENHQRKINWLRHKKVRTNNIHSPTQHQLKTNEPKINFHPRYTNLTNVTIQGIHEKIMNIGFKYAAESKPNIDLLAIELEQGTNYDPEKETIRKDIIQSLNIMNKRANANKNRTKKPLPTKTSPK
jgi:hypothetical protein